MIMTILVFGFVFFLNIIPIFAPPTWLVLSAIVIYYKLSNILFWALIGAAAATLGRLVLAKLSHKIIRERFLGERSKKNIDDLKKHLERRQTLTFSIFLFYAFSPLPSNYLFIAYGLTTMKLRLIAVPFFVGRSLSYSFWTVTASAVARRVSSELTENLSYLGVYFFVSQLLLLSMVYMFTRIDWRALFNEKKLRWIAAGKKSPVHSPHRP